MENMADTARKAGIIPEWPKPPKVMPTPPPPRLIKQGSKAQGIFMMILIYMALASYCYIMYKGGF